MNRTGNFLKTNAQRYALIGACFGLLFPILATLIRTSFLGTGINPTSVAAVFATDPLLWIIVSAPVFLGIFAAIAGRRQDKLEKTNSALKIRERELQAAQQVLEDRVNERTRELKFSNQLFLERAQLLDAVVETSRGLLVTEGLEQLLPSVVQTIGQRFNFYHVSLYLLDEQMQHAVLMASSNEDHQQLIQQGEQTSVPLQSQIEFAIRSGRVQIVRGPDSNPKINPDPQSAGTHAQLILPLTSGQVVIGALDLQADNKLDFTEEYISGLQILAGLVTIAIQNSILFDKTKRTLHDAEVNSRQISAREWSEWMESLQTQGFRYNGIRAEPFRGVDGNSSSQKRTQSIPIRLRGRMIGSLRVTLAEGTTGWSEDDHAIAEATAERAALALEGARLLEEAKKHATREAFLSDMAAKLGSSFRLDSILRDTVEELGQTLNNATVSFQLIDPSTSRGVKAWADKTGKPEDQE